MEEISLRNKDISIVKATVRILEYFGWSFFERYQSDGYLKLIDFWEDDLFAIGLKRKQKVIYLSAWDFRLNILDNMRYYVEFEIIDAETLEPIEIIKEFSEISLEDLLKEIHDFLK
jgi:hypothetical protein